MYRSDFMQNLMCNVTTCGHNKHNLCCKDGIQVGGSQAFVRKLHVVKALLKKQRNF